MTSVLSYSHMSDPFASQAALAQQAQASLRYPSPPLSSSVPAPHQSFTPTSSAKGASTTPVQTPPVAQPPSSSSNRSVPMSGPDEFGKYGGPGPGTSQSTGAARARTSMNMPLPLAGPVASTSATTAHAYAFNPATGSATTPPNAAAAARKRQSHNPSAALNPAASPPKPEHLTDEYILHPSVYAWRMAHAKRPMVAFGPYVLLQTLGEGEFGKVKLGVHTEYGVEVAIKLIRRGSLDDEARANKVEREIDVLKTLKHPNIVRMFDVIDTDKYIGIVLEFAGGGELFDHILANKYLKDRDAQRLFAQLISGVDYLHKKHIVHRDLKLENLLLDKHRNVIITDFGFANRFDQASDDLMATSCGSPCYAAPELVVSEGLYVGSAVDIWSCGVILYAMLSGYLPFDDDPDNPDGDNINLLYRYIVTTKLNIPEHVSPIAADLLKIMLVPDPEQRCTINDIMAHPWLASQREIFDRSVELNEWLLQDSMYKKSQLAKRELNERKRVAEEAKHFRAIQRSQSSMPGTTVTASMLDQRRKHQSALPGAVTVPEHLANAGHRTPPLSAIMRSTPPESSSPQLATPAIAAAAISARLADLAPATSSPLTPQPSSGPASAIAVEDEPLSRSVPITDSEVVRTPMSQNKNRHTIQVEYDADATYERMKAELEAQRDTQGTSYSEPSGTPLDVGAEVFSDAEMSGSEIDHTPRIGHTAEGTMESVETRLSPGSSEVHTPTDVAALPDPAPVPGTPTKRKPDESIGSPSTPRASRIISPEDVSATPRADAGTPKARRASSKATSRPPVSIPPSLALPNSTGTYSGLNNAGLPQVPPPKRDRSKKGMSLDKFGLSKLLNSAGMGSSVDVSRPPPSASSAATAASLQGQQDVVADGGRAQRDARRDSARPAAKKEEKQSKRKTLGAMVRSGSIRDSRPATPSTPAPLSARDMNPAAATPAAQPSSVRGKTSPIVVGPTGIQPQNANLGQSSPSIVTVDAVAQSQGKNASSSAAKKVMDWFRRKSLAKETYSGRPEPARSDSRASSFVRVEEPTRAASERTGAILQTPTAASSRSSVAVIPEEEALSPVPAAKEEVPVPDSATLPSAASRIPEPVRQPLAETSAGNVARNSPQRQTIGAAGRSKSHHAQAALPAAASASVPKLPLPSGTAAQLRVEEAKLRIHTGIVDQSALSSKLPSEVISEVIKVLMEMGLDVKRENEYRLRCTRPKKGAARGGLRGSVMSIGGSTGGFLLGNASSSRIDSRGLPMPQSPSASILSSGGFKGMLRRGSSAAGVNLPLASSEPQGLASPAMSSMTGTPILPSVEPIYGEHAVDSGDEVKFNVELCRIKNLPGLYLLNIKRLRGNVWSFKFIYQTVIERCETLTH